MSECCNNYDLTTCGDCDKKYVMIEPDELEWLKSLNKTLNESSKEHLKELTRLREENKVLIEALEFYSHGRSWSKDGEGAYADLGKTARTALAKVGENTHSRNDEEK